ncbi:hypothetical protein LKR43_13135 [Pusillimonas sp. MFBS29]|uniref:hypothetical protein n=1 Tax=Pusillimonas sp. MFBS29 TaxID=2886690 RepID=UPI001D11ECEA|nr:hypothetical protein [Pusillimonas sp. MFBS29]MCC2597282.1 hypothetical protein [Pusillimonas sp. MFBS29]
MPLTLLQLPDYWRDHFLKFTTNPLENPYGYPSLRSVLLSLRDMPYARPSRGNTVRDCITEWTGTCSAKHMAAHEWLTLMGHAPQFWMACYIMDFKRPYYSDQLRTAASAYRVYDVHNFVTCDLGHGEITIDITFPAPLGRHGFPITQDWEGNNNFTLCCDPLERIALHDLNSADQHKRSWLQSLNTSKALRLREAAILEMAGYVGTD